MKNKNTKAAAAAVVVFAFVIAVFIWGISGISDSSASGQLSNLENALNQDITYCYAVEGAYPESIEYIKENYGLVYDESRFYVAYKPMGANIKPDVTIIELEE